MIRKSGALTAEDFNITEPYYDARTGEYCITFSKVVKSDTGEFYGVFAIDFYLDVLMDILGESYSEQGYAFLVDVRQDVEDFEMGAAAEKVEESIGRIEGGEV